MAATATALPTSLARRSPTPTRSTGIRPPTPDGPATRSAASGESYLKPLRCLRGWPSCRALPAPAAWGSGRSAWRQRITADRHAGRLPASVDGRSTGPQATSAGPRPPPPPRRRPFQRPQRRRCADQRQRQGVASTSTSTPPTSAPGRTTATTMPAITGTYAGRPSN